MEWQHPDAPYFIILHRLTPENFTRQGKSLVFRGLYFIPRLTLRVPLVRLFQEVETFRHRAIGDTWQTVNRMEALRSEYRAVLLWMADISKELDPEAYRKLDKYREVSFIKMSL